MSSRSTAPGFSIVIPTRNRPQLLRNCLQGIENQRFDGQLHRVIVVDNGDPDDDIEGVVEGFSRALPVLYRHSGAPGVSRARNFGLAESQSDVTVFLDDDEIPCDNWLTEMATPFIDKEIGADIVAGNYSPIWETARPDWLTDDYLGLYSVSLEYGSTPRFLTSGEWILEGNVGVKTHLLKSVGGFDEGLGREGDSLVSGEGAVYTQLVKSGARLFYNPNCLVKHLIHRDRLHKKWLQKRMFAAGVTQALQERNGLINAKTIPPVTVNLGALARLHPDSLSNDDLLHFMQIYEMFGYILRKQGII